MRSALLRINAILSARRFFQVIVAFFIFEAVWIVLSAAYPMAFDEDFHFGLIKIYSHYWLPFLGHQPANAAAYGAVARDPSYLYHYLMSFPYRLIALFAHSQTSQVIILRLINVGLFATGLVLFRRVLLRSRLSVALSNTILLMFALVPITPQLAAHINYDNLVFLLVAWTCLLAFQMIDEIRARKPSARTFLALMALCLFSSLVKYAFLPIFLGVVIFLVVMTHRSFHGNFRLAATCLWKSWRRMSKTLQILLATLFILGSGMFVQRDVVNLIDYHAIVPDCSKVLSKQTCSAYPVWYYTYNSHETVITEKQESITIGHYNPITYVGVWVYWMWYRLFFAISGPAGGFVNYPPLPLPSAAAAIMAISGVITVVIWRRRIFHNNPYLTLFFIISVLYVLALLVDGYTAYRYTDVLQTMNGRYLLPVLLLIAAIIGKAFSLELQQTPARKTILAAIALFFFLQGGGFLTFIERSDPSWNWSNKTVVEVNNAARTVTKPLVIKGSKSYSTRIWLFN